MRRSFYGLGALTLTIHLMGCGTTVRPHVSQGDRDQPTGFPRVGGLAPRPAPELGVEDDARALVDRICRAQAMRPGWIATRYEQGAENCPESTDPENAYTAAVIERHSHKQVGSTMIACADQPVPGQWVREYAREVQATCPGARVRDGAPTAMVIRRVAER